MGRMVPDEQLALGAINMAERLGSRKVAHHDGKRLVAAALAAAQLRNGALVGCVAREMEASEPLDGNDAALGDTLGAPLDDVVAGGQVDSYKRLSIACERHVRCGPHAKQALGCAWKRRSSGSAYSAAHAGHRGKSAIDVCARS